MSNHAAISGPDDERELRLIESYETYLLLMAGRIMSCRFVGPKSASDFVQETILAAVQAGDHRPETQAANDDYTKWITGVLRNKITEALRHESILRREQYLNEGPTDSHDSPLPEAIKREKSRRLLAALDRLSPEDRQLIDWSLEGVSRREIGERLSISASYASRICKQAMYRLREDYSDGVDSSGI